MMTLRRYLAAQYDLTGLSSKVFTSGISEVIALSLVGMLVFALVLAYHLYYVRLPMSDFVSTPMGLEHMFDTIVYFTAAVFLIPAFIISANGIRMYRFTMKRANGGVKIPLRFYLAEVKVMILHLLSHKNIRKCLEVIHKKRWTKHWLLGLACTVKFAIVLFFLSWFQTDSLYPLYHPQRWLGYFVAAILIYVPADILIGRIKRRQEMHKFSEPSDLTLPIMLLLVAVSGIMVHVFRYLGFSLASHYAYAVHLAIAVPLIIIELPFGKWSHVLYRPLAIYFQAVKERAFVEATTVVERESSAEVVTLGR